jgi:chemotaxis protein MotA
LKFVGLRSEGQFRRPRNKISLNRFTHSNDKPSGGGTYHVFVIVGFLTVLGCVMGGFLLHKGNPMVLFQPEEFLIIGGAAIGSLLIASPPALLKAIIAALIGTVTGKGITKEDYTEVLLCIYELTKTGKGNMLGLEAHVETPEASEIFKKYPGVLANHHALHFICDTLKVQISSPMSPYDLDDLMEIDIEAAHHEELKVPATVNRVGDAMPGLGIVAAVLGVVITMGHLTEGKEVIGESVAAALVGTFIGILLSYGFIQPLAAKIEATIGDGGAYLHVIKSGLLAFAKDASPKVCVEYARRTIPPEVRPSFHEVDEATAGAKKAA